MTLSIGICLVKHLAKTNHFLLTKDQIDNALPYEIVPQYHQRFLLFEKHHRLFQYSK